MMRGGESSQRLRKNVLVSKINQKLVILPIIGIIQRFQHTIFCSLEKKRFIGYQNSARTVIV